LYAPAGKTWRLRRLELHRWLIFATGDRQLLTSTEL
jgi:hypothetical protein